VGFLTCRALALQTRTGGIGAAAREEPHLVDSEVLFTLKLLESQFHNDVAPLMVSELIISENQSFLESRDEPLGEYFMKKVYASGRVFMSSSIAALCVGCYYMPSLNELVKHLMKTTILVVNVPGGWERRPYKDLFYWLLWEKNLLAIGLYRRSSTRRGDYSYVFTNPPINDVTLAATDQVYCLVPTRREDDDSSSSNAGVKRTVLAGMM
jgi:hypothetical protein